MKKFIGLLIVSIFAGFVFWSCSDDSATSPTNKAPTCTITAPATNIVVDEGSVIDVSVTAQDADGEIEKVYFYLNTTIIDSASSSPYNAAISTLNLEIGEFYIIAYAKDDDGAESYPDSISFSNTPKAPSNFNISQVDISSANLTWSDNSFSEEKFVIERKLSTESEYQIISEITGNDISTKIYTDINLEPALSYDYRIKTVKETSESIYINQSYNNVFSPPSALTIIQNNVYTFTLNWADNSIGEDGFKVERKIDDGTFTVLATVTGNSYVDNTVLKKGYGTVYYQVRAYKGTTYYSTFATANSAVLFPAPSGLIYTKENIDTIKLEWTDNSTGEEGFKIDKKIGESDWVIGFASVTENIKTWTDTNAEINEVIDYRVYGFKGLNLTETISSSEIDNTFPAPTDLAVLQTSVTSANLEWSDNSIGEEKFEIERKLSTESNYLNIGEVTGSDTTNKTWIDSNLTPNEIYDYRIKAVKNVSSSEYIFVYSHSNVFLSPSNLSIYIESSTSLRLIWIDDVDGEEYFSIDRKIGQDGTWNELYSTSESNTNTWVDSGLSTGTIYFYRLRAYASNFYTNYTQEVNLAPQITPNNMVIVPIGSFMMGQENVATPVHSVTITRPFYLGRRELSQLEWSLYMPADIYGLGQGDNYPVYNVSWYEILVYCNLRSIDEGLNPCYTIKGSTDPSYWFDIPTETNSDWNSVICNFEANGYRLPTEAEWEYTARYNDGRAYPWGYGIAPSTELCNYNNMVGSTTEVTSYSRGASELYLLNLSGNVSEWLWDVYATYSSTAQTDPTGPLTGGARVRRGGSWNTFWVRLTDRVYSHPYGQGSEVGFRLARTRK